MKVEIKGDEMIIRIPINRDLKPSKSGKSLTVATTGGNIQTDVEYQGKKLTVGVNAYVKA